MTSTPDDEYKDYEDSDPRLEAVDEQISNLPRTREVSSHMMTKLYSESFVDRLVTGEFSPVDRGKGSEVINDYTNHTEDFHAEDFYSKGPALPAKT